MFNVLFYLLLMFMLFPADNRPSSHRHATPPSDPAEFIGVPLGEPFALKWGHPGAVGDTDVIVMFDGIVVDPRCPEGVTCTNEGPVAAEFTVTGPRWRAGTHRVDRPHGRRGHRAAGGRRCRRRR